MISGRLTAAMFAATLIAFPTVTGGCRGASEQETVARIFNDLGDALPYGEVEGLRGFSPLVPDDRVHRAAGSENAQALYAAEQRLNAKPMSVERYNAVGYLQLYSGQHNSARQSYQHVLDQDPANLEAAIGYAVSSLALVPTENPNRSETLALAKDVLGKALERSAPGDPGREPGLYNLVLILRELGLAQESSAALDSYLDLNPPRFWSSRLETRL